MVIVSSMIIYVSWGGADHILSSLFKQHKDHLRIGQGGHLEWVSGLLLFYVWTLRKEVHCGVLQEAMLFKNSITKGCIACGCESLCNCKEDHAHCLE